MVENVEELRFELEVHSLAEMELATDGKVQLRHGKSTQRVAPEIAGPWLSRTEEWSNLRVRIAGDCDPRVIEAPASGRERIIDVKRNTLDQIGTDECDSTDAGSHDCMGDINGRRGARGKQRID